MADEGRSSLGAPGPGRVRRVWLGISAAAMVGAVALWLGCGTCGVHAGPEPTAKPGVAEPSGSEPKSTPAPNGPQQSSAEPKSADPQRRGGEYSPEERRALLVLARRSVAQAAQRADAPEVPDGISAHLRQEKGAFVTLTKGGQLRGCIGHIFPEQPLVEAVIDNARNATLRDPRFSPVTPDELGDIAIEVSVLSVPKPLPFSSPEDLLGKLRPNVHGVVLNVGGSRATFLPQVWEQLPDKVEFLSHLSAKAGREPTAWRGSGTEVQTYTAEAFEESDFGLPGHR
ncbi:MAG: AmmeMemoRadiSam system protein A [Polyangiaceae bacterium]|nr:AmmeMemoRadiSam system protein A [Polyangiaceae bacterium]